MNLQPYISWGTHTGFLLLQGYLAFKAQNDPRWAWVAPVLGVAQSSFPSPFKNNSEKKP